MTTTALSVLIAFINSFDPKKHDFSNLPPGFPDCDTSDLNREQSIKYSIAKSYYELYRPKKPVAQSRVWQDPKGYEYLAVWQNTALLRILIRKFTLTLPLSPTLPPPLRPTLNSPLNNPYPTLNLPLNNPYPTLKKPFEFRLKAQLDDAARSTKRNIEEGWKRPTTAEYLTFLGYSQASLAEVKGDARDCKDDGFLKEKPGSSLKDIGISLDLYKGPFKGQLKGEPTNPKHPYYEALQKLNPQDLTYEMFLELINKTDYLLRQLVISLEKKLDSNQKHYQIEKARIRSNLKWK